MNDSQLKGLCLELMRADKEEEIIHLLGQAGHWDNPAAWRYYGDRETNFNTIGNQQSRPEAALVEKLVNAVDARLMNECLVRGIDPESERAPGTIREAVALFFEEHAQGATAGLVSEWSEDKRTEVARSITLAATGAMPDEGSPSLTISDCGEGQTPRGMPDTLLSLDLKNKLRIAFVQGKFNMGGTGALEFCGRHNLQLVVTRRNPQIVGQSPKDPSDLQWGFTIVRREDPEAGRRCSLYTYLAPVGMENSPRKGGVLRFSYKDLPIFPKGRDAYARDSEWGTLIKLYEYSLTSSRSHILLKKGLLSRVDLLMPDVALPIRLHECRRGYRGHGGSFETTLTGLGVRLGDDRTDNLEEGFPSSSNLRVAGEQMTATIYAFRKGKAETYRGPEGVVLTINGQTHGHLPTDFFRREAVGQSYLRDALLVLVDCSRLSGRAREDLFMNSRDRLRRGPFGLEVETALAEMLRQHGGLRALREQRRRDEVDQRLADSRPLGDVLEDLFKRSPSLAALLLQGKQISNPFKAKTVEGTNAAFQGKRHPTYFRFKDKPYGEKLHRDCHANMRCRVIFETDAENDYFSRQIDPGEFSLFLLVGSSRSIVRNYLLNLQNGLASLNLQLPPNSRIGDELRFEAYATDGTRADPFQNAFTLRVTAEAPPTVGGRGGRRRPPGKEQGSQREVPGGLQIPVITLVYEKPADGAKGWQDMVPPFDKYSALRAKNAGSSDDIVNVGDGPTRYDFFVNADNVYLKAEQKVSSVEPEMLQARFEYGMVLMGLALLHEAVQRGKEHQKRDEDTGEMQAEERNVEDVIEEFSRAVGPVLLPMIEHLGGLDADGDSDSDGQAATTP